MGAPLTITCLYQGTLIDVAVCYDAARVLELVTPWPNGVIDIAQMMKEKPGARGNRSTAQEQQFLASTCKRIYDRAQSGAQTPMRVVQLGSADAGGAVRKLADGETPKALNVPTAGQAAAAAAKRANAPKISPLPPAGRGASSSGPGAFPANRPRQGPPRIEPQGVYGKPRPGSPVRPVPQRNFGPQAAGNKRVSALERQGPVGQGLPAAAAAPSSSEVTAPSSSGEPPPAPVTAPSSSGEAPPNG